MRKLRHKGIKVTQLIRGRARIQGGLGPKAILFITLPALTHVLWGFPQFLADPGSRGRREAQARYPVPMASVIGSGESMGAKPGPVVPSPRTLLPEPGNKSLSLSKKVAEPPENGASTDWGMGV